MTISYNKLWKMLIDKKMSCKKLRQVAVMPPRTMIYMRRNELINIVILDKICRVIGAYLRYIIEYVPDESDHRFDAG